MPHVILFACWGFIFWLIRRDMARREGLSSAIWIPTIWVAIISSRPVSFWLGFGGGSDSLEGSPADRAFFFIIIFAAIWKLSKRRLNWNAVISKSWPVFLFYGFLLVSIFWAEYTFVSFKRWFKEFGNIFIAMLILTEEKPEEAFRAVFVRCAYVLLPLSIVFIRYFPNLGRHYTTAGALESVGVTSQKNSLGALVTVCGLVLMWDWFERMRDATYQRDRMDRYLPLAFLLIGAYLLYQCDSKTSIACLMVGALILAAAKLPFLRKRMGVLSTATFVLTGAFLLLDWAFGIKETVVTGMGRDMTFTGRTDLWRELLDLKTDPLIGTGFCSFWSDKSFQSRLPVWLADGRSAHNGFFEVYIDGGIIGLCFLAIMLLGVGWKLHRQLSFGGDYILIRFAVFVTTVIGNLSESHFGRMTPLGFLFLLTAIGKAEQFSKRRSAAKSTSSANSPRGFGAPVRDHVG